jgi:phage shock protein A
MKKIMSVPLLLLAAASFAAGEVDIPNIVDARLAQLQAEVWLLDNAIDKLAAGDLADEQWYEEIAGQAFATTDEIVATHGLTLKQLLSYEADHHAELQIWLQQHAQQLEQMDALEEQIMQLQQRLDQLMQASSG